jgi:hypothetical protein
VLEEVVEMPANNLSVLLRKQAAARVRKHAFTGPATDAARPQALPTAIRKEPR